MPEIDYGELDKLMNTDAANSESPAVKSDSPANAAAWCSGTVPMRRDVPAGEHCTVIGMRRGCLTKLSNAINAHDAGTQTLDAATLDAANVLRTCMGHNQAADASPPLEASTQDEYNQLVARLDLLVGASPPIYTTDDRTATLDLTLLQIERYRLVPATVDANEFGRVRSRWMGDAMSSGVGANHVIRCREIAAGTAKINRQVEPDKVEPEPIRRRA